jgi:iron complex outermembrane receptor protein
VGTQEVTLSAVGIANPDDPAGVNLPLVSVNRSKTASKFTFRVALDHDFSSDVLGYVSMNRGFRSGGYNAGDFTDKGFTPETLDAYEIGLKTELFERKIRWNSSAFYYDYKNIQVQILEGGGAIGVVNGGNARIYGLDSEVEARLTDNFRLSAGLELLSTKFLDFPNAPTGSPDGSLPATSQSATGNQLPLAAKETANLAADYRVNAAGHGSINFNAVIYYNSGFAAESDNLIRQKAFEQLNASATWTLPNERTTLSVWGKNLTNQQIQGFESTLPYGGHLVLWSAPLTYGITAGYKF